MLKVLVSDKLSKEGIDILSKTGKIQVDVKVGLKPEELNDYFLFINYILYFYIF